MDTQEKNILKWFWPWQDQKRETWLRLMSQDGWHLRSIGFGGLAFRFTPGEKTDYIYQLDFRQESAQNMADYLDLFENAGWEYVLSWNGWQYFRKQFEDGEKDQIFTDNQSKVQKYRRLLVKLTLFFPAYMIIFLAKLDRYPLWFAIFLVSFYVLVTLYVGISVLMVSLRIRQLEQEG